MPNYEELASLTSRFPELLIVRRFDRLSAYIVLSLQAELLYLEDELRQYVEMDRRNADVKDFLASWGEMRGRIKEGHLIPQVTKREEVEEKLKAYREYNAWF